MQLNVPAFYISGGSPLPLSSIGTVSYTSSHTSFSKVRSGHSVLIDVTFTVSSDMIPVGSNSYTHLILQVESSGSQHTVTDEVLHNNYASMPITVAPFPSCMYNS